MGHPHRSCLAEIVVTDPAGTESRGSGYRVALGWVLTAHHVVAHAGAIGVWFGAPAELRAEDGVAVDPSTVRAIPDLDLALLPLPDGTAPAGFVPPLFGALDRDTTTAVPAEAQGFPWFKLRPAPGRKNVLLREVHVATALVSGGANLKTGTLAFPVTNGTPNPHPDRKKSAWEGMSGAAVFTGVHLIGVVGQHHPAEGAGTLTVRPLQLPPGSTGAATDPTQDWAGALTQLRQPLPIVTPPTARELADRDVQTTAARLAPDVLGGRQSELAELAGFATTEDSAWRWIQAEAFAGKTALLAHFALHPPELVDVAACFLQTTTGQNTATYALTVLSQRLAVLAGHGPYLAPTLPAGLINQFPGLLAAAAAASQQRGHRLLLIIDGLDEYSPAESLRLKTWLPDQHTLPDTASLLVSSRAGVRIPIPNQHPLTAHTSPLDASTVAADVREQARDELDTAVGADNPLRYETIACLAAAGAPIRVDDLSCLLGRRGQPVDPGYLHRHVARWFHRTIRTMEDADGAAGFPTLVFSHETLLDAAETHDSLAHSIPTIRDQLHSWAAEYDVLPDDTPPYLLTGYPRLLSRLHDTDHLTALALNTHRHTRLRDLTGGDAAALEEVRAAQALLADADDPDLVSIGLLAWHRDRLADRNRHIPTDLPAVFAALGHTHRALAMASSITDPYEQTRALTALAIALATTGEHQQALQVADRAEDTAATIPSPRHRAQALTTLAARLATAGYYDRAAATATTIPDPNLKALALTALAKSLSTAGMYDRAEDTAATIPSPPHQARALTALAIALANAGHYDRAEATATTILHPYRQAEALTELTAALATAGHYDQAAATAATIDDPSLKALALNTLAFVLAIALATLGHYHQADSTATTIPDPGLKALALAKIANALAVAGHRRLARQAAGRATTTAAAIRDPHERVEALTLVAIVLAAEERQLALQVAGQAAAITATITDPYQRTQALTAMTSALAAAEAHQLALQVADKAEATALAVTDLNLRTTALMTLVILLTTAGEYDRAETTTTASVITALRYSEAITVLIAGLAAAGEGQRAVQVADRAAATAATISEPEERVEVLAALAAALAATGETEHALRIAECAAAASASPEPCRHVSSLSAMTSALAAAGDHQRALHVAHLAAATTATIVDPDQRDSALTELTAALATAGDYNRAAATAAAITNPDQQSWALRALTTALATAGEFDRAEVTAATITDAAERAIALQALTTALATAGHYERAEATAATITSPYWRVSSLTGLTTALATAEQRHRARHVADRAQAFTATITSPHQRMLALTSVTTAFAAAGEFYRAAATAATITDPDLQTRALAALATALATAGEPQRALQVADQAADTAATLPEECLANALSARVTALAAASDYDSALATAATITSSYEQSMALTTLATALATAGHYGRAEATAASITNPDQQAEALTDIAMLVVGFAELACSRRILARAWLAGSWEIPLRALTRIEPQVLSQLVDHEAAIAPRPRAE